MLSALRFLKDAVQPTHPRNPTRESAVVHLSRKPRILSTNYCKTQIIKAETPPAIYKNAFDPIPDGFIIYVPYSSLDSYLDSWGVFSSYLRGYAF